MSETVPGLTRHIVREAGWYPVDWKTLGATCWASKETP